MKLTEEKKVRVFRQDKQTSNGNTFATYSLGVSSKDVNGNWVNGFIPCKFKKGVSVENKADIKITNAFPTVRAYNDRTFVEWMITEFEVVNNGENSGFAPAQSAGPAPTTSNDGFMKIDENVGDSFPFPI